MLMRRPILTCVLSFFIVRCELYGCTEKARCQRYRPQIRSSVSELSLPTQPALTPDWRTVHLSHVIDVCS